MGVALPALALLIPWAVFFHPTIAISDGESLLFALNSWKVNLSWVGDPCSQNWEGVRCNDNHRVVALNLSNKGLIGPIPDVIGNLEDLQNLDLSNLRHSKPPLNTITGDISALGGLINLQSLNLSFNKIQLNQFPSVVFNLTNLTALRIDNNFISGSLPPELSQLTKLQYLYLGNNSMEGPLPQEFGNLVNLLELSLWNNNLQSTIPSQFGNLINLIYLNLHDCNLYGGLPSELGNLKSILSMSLYNNRLTGIIPDNWKNLANMKYLLLNNNYLTKSFPQWILQLHNLLNVSLSHNFLYGNAPNFPSSKLKNVSITCNFLSGTTPTSPSSLVLNYSGNCFVGSDPNEKIKCSQSPYFDCNDFLVSISNGNCPDCPPLQVLEDETTCVCTISQTGGKKSGQTGKLVGSIVGVVGFLILVFSIWWFYPKSRKRLINKFTSGFYQAQDFWEGPEGVQRFSLQDLARATDNFNVSHEIGKGGFGNVYYGILDTGKKVAIKRASSSSIQSSAAFRNEVLLLSRLHHRNLVHLLGFCEDDGVQILVYEYMPNGNLHTLLFKNNNGVILDWLRRLDIAVGVAQGLEYLHSFADPPVIHRDVKPSNILLDENLVAKLADFGISRAAPEFETSFATTPAGTVGYIDPQYILRQHLTTASDVYSFGMVLLELISGQKAIDSTREEDHNLVEWAKLKLNTVGLKSIVDPRLGEGYPEQVYQDIVRLAIDCASFNSEERPSMKAVVTILDACRWAVSPPLEQVATDTHNYPHGDYISEEEYFAIETSLQGHTDSVEEGSRSFSVSLLLPR